MSDVRPATDLCRRGDVVHNLRASQEHCMCHEKNVVQMTTYLDAATATPNDVAKVARALWVRDGLPVRAFDVGDATGIIACGRKGGVAVTAREGIAELKATYLADARKIVAALGLGGNVDDGT